MKMKSSILIAAALALGTVGVAAASIEKGRFSRMTQSEYDLMVRDGHDAWQRSNDASAQRNFLKSACAGDKDSQFALGTMYLTGDGAPADGLKAYAWYSLAAEIDDKRYREAFAKVSALVPEQYRELADAEGQRLRQSYGLDATGQRCRMDAQVGTRIQRRVCRPEITGGSQARFYLVRQCEGPEQAKLASLGGRD